MGNYKYLPGSDEASVTSKLIIIIINILGTHLVKSISMTTFNQINGARIQTALCQTVEASGVQNLTFELYNALIPHTFTQSLSLRHFSSSCLAPSHALPGLMSASLSSSS